MFIEEEEVAPTEEQVIKSVIQKLVDDPLALVAIDPLEEAPELSEPKVQVAQKPRISRHELAAKKLWVYGSKLEENLDILKAQMKR